MRDYSLKNQRNLSTADNRLQYVQWLRAAPVFMNVYEGEKYGRQLEKDFTQTGRQGNRVVTSSTKFSVENNDSYLGLELQTKVTKEDLKGETMVKLQKNKGTHTQVSEGTEFLDLSSSQALRGNLPTEGDRQPTDDQQMCEVQ